MDKEPTERDIQLKKTYIEAQVEEFGRLLPGIVLLINEDETKDLKFVLWNILESTWDAAQKPLMDALINQYKV